ncbi:MAG TPA: acyltransferase [Chthoniobacteraceae bacterium]|nr:acyltransferase [Chthoniobacteraceae bacterium]
MNPHASAKDPIQKWEIKASTGRHFDALDGLRGVAILMVVIHHTFYTNPTNRLMKGIEGLIEAGWIGVPVFFVLSGFLISYPFFQAREKNSRAWYVNGYARRRIGKIIPPFYLSIVIFWVLYLFQYHDFAYVNAGAQWALGLPNFIVQARNFNLSYWSLVVEVHFYILLPLLFWLTRGMKTRPASWMIFFILAVVPPVVRHLTWPSDPAMAADQKITGFLMIRFPCELDYFAWGVLFGGWFVSLAAMREKMKHLAALGYAGILLFAVTLCLFSKWAWQYGIAAQPRLWSVEFFHWAPGISAFLMLFFVFDPDCAAARLLGLGWLRFIGLVSYEWFLFHGPVVRWFAEVYGKTHGSAFDYLMKTVVPLALTFVFSVALYRWFSLPIMNRIRATVKR